MFLYKITRYDHNCLSWNFVSHTKELNSQFFFRVLITLELNNTNMKTVEGYMKGVAMSFTTRNSLK